MIRIFFTLFNFIIIFDFLIVVGVLNLKLLLLRVILFSFLGLVDDILLDDVLLKFSHLVRIQFEAHLLGRSDQIWVDHLIVALNFFFLFLLTDELLVRASELLLVLCVLFLVELIIFALVVPAALLLIDDLLDLLVCFVGLSHQRLLSHFEWVALIERFVLLAVVLILVLHWVVGWHAHVVGGV